HARNGPKGGNSGESGRKESVEGVGQSRCLERCRNELPVCGDLVLYVRDSKQGDCSDKVRLETLLLKRKSGFGRAGSRARVEKREMHVISIRYCCICPVLHVEAIGVAKSRRHRCKPYLEDDVRACVRSIHVHGHRVYI